VVLERCIIYEKKQEVRDAAAVALQNLRERRALPPQTGSSVTSSRGRTAPAEVTSPATYEVPRLSPSVPSPSARPSPFQSPARREEPGLEGPGTGDAQPSGTERVPPPPPTPVNPT
jgi:hypothetical protein